MSLFFGEKMPPLKDIEENIYSSVMVSRKEPEEGGVKLIDNINKI